MVSISSTFIVISRFIPIRSQLIRRRRASGIVILKPIGIAPIRIPSRRPLSRHKQVRPIIRPYHYRFRELRRGNTYHYMSQTDLKDNQLNYRYAAMDRLLSHRFAFHFPASDCLFHLFLQNFFSRESFFACLKAGRKVALSP